MVVYDELPEWILSMKVAGILFINTLHFNPENKEAQELPAK